MVQLCNVLRGVSESFCQLNGIKGERFSLFESNEQDSGLLTRCETLRTLCIEDSKSLSEIAENVLIMSKKCSQIVDELDLREKIENESINVDCLNDECVVLVDLLQLEGTEFEKALQGHCLAPFILFIPLSIYSCCISNLCDSFFFFLNFILKLLLHFYYK